MIKLKLMALCCLLSGMLVACGKQPEVSEKVSVENPVEKVEEVDAVKTESEKNDNKIAADEYYFDKCTSSYFMTESLLDDEIADKLSHTSAKNIRSTGSSVKFMTMLCRFDGVFDTDITPTAIMLQAHIRKIFFWEMTLLISITTTFDGAKELFEDMNYQVVDRFANKAWLATNDSHPVYDTVMFMGTFERRAAEAYYALLVKYAAETDYEGEKDLLITYTNDAGEEIWINRN